MSRLDRFLGYRDHGWHGKRFATLTEAEIRVCVEFIHKHQEMDRGAFEHAVNRMFLGVDRKPKRWSLMQELLSCANSA